MTREEIIKTNQIYPEYKYKPNSPWINIKTDLPCNHNELICSKEISEGTETTDVCAMNEYGDIWVDYMGVFELSYQPQSLFLLVLSYLILLVVLVLEPNE